MSVKVLRACDRDFCSSSVELKTWFFHVLFLTAARHLFSEFRILKCFVKIPRGVMALAKTREAKIAIEVSLRKCAL